ncbi:uncharacterized protein HGUI_03447 [Hanseniaspora guilliermondii]|uniref:non-specific serine/threonine protein kinase n=1 Tax=Hanseniaspora guilliermondii TaxID=56406 RepID=A0A1L0D289_9ASCO|nr:uncharacterized protein HGUI_03447 [Hanseniaspora guilliermondii]
MNTGGSKSPQRRPNNMKTMSPQDFVFLNKIGSGSYSEVYKAKYKTAIDDFNNKRQHFFAIKICSKEHIIREQKEKYVNVEKLTLLKLASKMIHPGIVNLYYTFHDTYNLYFVLDYISCGELFTYLYNSINKSMIQDYKIIERFVAQLLDTLKYLEINSIVHRDLKPENILLNKKGCLMITDFGVACDLSNSQRAIDDQMRASSFVGTADYVSPELLLTNSCSYKADIWAAGCIFYQLRQGYPPFRGKNELETFENIVSGNHKPMLNMEDNIDYLDLVKQLLVVDEDNRLSVDEAMTHPFCNNINWEQKNMIWTGIWEGPYPLDPHGDYYMNKNTPPTSNIINNVNGSPSKNVNNSVRTKGIGVPRKRKPITTQNIVEWRKQLGINGSTSSVSSAVPVIEKGFRGIQLKDQGDIMNSYGDNMNTSSRAAAQLALKRQVMKNVAYTSVPQPSPHVKMVNAARQQPKNKASGLISQEQPQVNVNVLKREINVPYHKIPYLEMPKNSNIYLDYHTFNRGITKDKHNCELFMNFMDVNAGKIMDILDDEMKNKAQKNNVLEVYTDGKVKIYNQGDKTGILVGDLTNELMNIYEYTPERKKGELIDDKGTWCIIESNDKSIYLMPYLSKDWNKLFKQIKKKNKVDRENGKVLVNNDQMMIKNAASMAYKR